jgi:FMN reductase
MNATKQQTFRLVVVSAGTSDPSSTRLLAGRTAQRVATLAGEREHTVTTEVLDLRELATEITAALISPMVGPRLREAITTLG